MILQHRFSLISNYIYSNIYDTYYKVISITHQQEKEAERRRNVEKALEDMKKQEKEVALMHEKEQVDKEEEVIRRKGKIECEMKDNILSANR